MMADNGGGRLFLRSVRIGNYKCLSGFELPFGDMTLLLGKNGCGKSATFGEIDALRRFVCNGERVWDLFPASTLTRWGGGNNNEQSFELCAKTQRGGRLCYRLAIEHLSGGRAQVKEETLTAGNSPVFECVGGEAVLYENFHGRRVETARFSPDKHASALAGFCMRNENIVRDNLPWQFLRALLGGITMLSLRPKEMLGYSDAEAQHPNADGSNFASWYRRIARENDAGIAAANQELNRILPRYLRLTFVKVGDGNRRELRAVFYGKNGAERDYAFAELSDGERALIALYCFMHCGGRGRVLLLDMPDNFITLPEVKPLFVELNMEAGDGLPQIAIVSHHPAAMDYIAARETIWMDREPEQPARIVHFKNDTMLSTSQLFAQGGAP